MTAIMMLTMILMTKMIYNNDKDDDNDDNDGNFVVRYGRNLERSSYLRNTTWISTNSRRIAISAVGETKKTPEITKKTPQKAPETREVTPEKITPGEKWIFVPKDGRRPGAATNIRTGGARGHRGKKIRRSVSLLHSFFVSLSMSLYLCLFIFVSSSVFRLDFWRYDEGETLPFPEGEAEPTKEELLENKRLLLHDYGLKSN